MAWSFGAEVEASASASGTSIAATPGANPSAGSVLWVVSRCEANTTSTISDTQTSGWANINSVVEAATLDELFQAYAKNITGGADTVTATFGASVANRGIYVLEIIGVDTAAPLVDSDAVTDTGANPTANTTCTNGGFAGVLVTVGNDVQGGLLTVRGSITAQDLSIWASTAAQRGTVGYQSLAADTSNYTANYNNASVNRSCQVAAIFQEPSAATATTLSGPTAGVTGVDSSNFTVGANGIISGTVTVAPNDSSGGGTFTPTSVAISSGTPTATFTYANTTAGTYNIGTTNNGGLSNPGSISHVVSLHIPLRVNSSGLRF